MLGADVGGAVQIYCVVGDRPHKRTMGIAGTPLFLFPLLAPFTDLIILALHLFKILALQKMKIKRFWIEGIYHVTHVQILKIFSESVKTENE